MKTMFSVFAVAALVAFTTAAADAKGGGRSSGARHSYGGGKHTTSHGGRYFGGSGSSHKGGTYKGPYGGYGTHK